MGKFWSRTELLSEVQCFLRSKRDSSPHGTCCRASSSQRCTSRTGCWTAKRHRHGQWMVVVGWSLRDAFGCLNLSYLLLDVCFVLDISNSSWWLQTDKHFMVETVETLTVSTSFYANMWILYAWTTTTIWGPFLFVGSTFQNCLMGRPRMGWQRLQITHLGGIIKQKKNYDLILP